MKKIVFIFFIALAGFLLGRFMVPANYGVKGFAIRHVMMPESVVNDFEMREVPIVPKGIEISGFDWRFFIWQNGTMNIASVIPQTEHRPMMSFRQANDDESHIDVIDSKGQIVNIPFSELGEFDSISVLVDQGDGKSYTFIDRGFVGFFSQAIEYPDGDILWGNFSEEWLPLKNIDGHLNAQKDDEWLPVVWRNDKLFFVGDLNNEDIDSNID